jgi:phosphatidylglycerophosphate synthase
LELSVVRQLPNAISITRIAAAFPVLLLYDLESSGKMVAVIAIIALAEASDHLDGLLARRLNAASEKGYILDGLGDRAFYSALVLALSCAHHINTLVVWLLVFGQVVVYGVRLMQIDWKMTNWRVRRLHLIHWGGIRLWVATFLVQDICSIWNFRLTFDPTIYSHVQYIIATLTIAALYYAIGLNVQTLLGAEQIE